MNIKQFCNHIRNFFEMHSAARIILYIVAMIQPAVNLLFFSSFSVIVSGKVSSAEKM